jgi:hypothetical protein
MDSPQEAAVERSGVPTFAVEAAVAALVFLLGLVVAVRSYLLGAGWTTDGPGAGYFPFYMGLIILISGAGIFYQALWGKKRKTEIFVDSEQLKRVLQVLLPAGVFVLGIQLVGVYVASAIYVAGFMVFLGKFRAGRSIAIGVALAVLIFMTFEVWFKIPLFKGALDPTRFLGY